VRPLGAGGRARGEPRPFRGSGPRRLLRMPPYKGNREAKMHSLAHQKYSVIAVSFGAFPLPEST